MWKTAARREDRRGHDSGKPNGRVPRRRSSPRKDKGGCKHCPGSVRAGSRIVHCDPAAGLSFRVNSVLV